MLLDLKRKVTHTLYRAMAGESSQRLLAFAHRVKSVFLPRQTQRVSDRPSAERLRQLLGDTPSGQRTIGSANLVLAVSHNLALEGASISLLELMKGLHAQHGLSVSVLAFEDGPLRLRYEQLGIRVQLLEARALRPMTLHSLQTLIKTVRGVITQEQPRLVFVNTIATFPVLIAAWLEGYPTILNVREGGDVRRGFSYLPQGVADIAYRALGLASRRVFVSTASREQWAPIFRSGHSHVFLNAIDVSRFQSPFSMRKEDARAKLCIRTDEFMMISVGTICARKGQLDILRAIASLRASFVSRRVRLFVIGDARSLYARQLSIYARFLNLTYGGTVRFVSSTDALGDYYRAADVFVFASRAESCPRVIFEAMSFGLPIVTTDVDGIPEQIGDGNALTYSPGKTALLASHLQRVLVDPSLRQSLSGRSLRRFLELPTYPEMVKRYAELIDHNFPKRAAAVNPRFPIVV